MSIDTRRALGSAWVEIDRERCIDCGLCARVCKNEFLIDADAGRVEIQPDAPMGCIACGACVATCPKDAIFVDGRDLSQDDVLPIPPRSDRASYDALFALLATRRSVREFKPREIPEAVVWQIVEAAATAPIGIPPSEVQVLVLHGRTKVAEFASEFLRATRFLRWLAAKPTQWLLRPLLGAETFRLFDQFVRPADELIRRKATEGEDWLLYGSPLAMLFHVSPCADPADPLIPATLAMVAGESLGLGTCLIGSVAPLLRSKALRKRYGIPPDNRIGIMVIFGYPAVRRRHRIRRTFGKVHFG
jgi:ferredoxin/nitroreductase